MSGQGDFFPEVPIPEWLPDELLFSLLSRFHRISGNHLHTETCQQIFGARRNRCAHDMPHWLDALASRAKGVLGSPEAIIARGTLLPAFLPFMSPSIAQEACDALKSVGMGRYRARLCRQTAGQLTVEPLRACPQCMQLDQETVGVAYWHMSHQVPGVLICVEHGQPLWRCTVSADGERNARWHLPQIKTLMAPFWTPSSLGQNGMEVLGRVAGVSQKLFATKQGKHLDPVKLRSEYVLSLAEHLPGAHPFHLEVLMEHAQQFRRFYAPVEAVPEFGDILSSLNASAAIFAEVICPSSEPLVPWNHLRVMAWLDPEVDTKKLFRE